MKALIDYNPEPINYVKIGTNISDLKDVEELLELTLRLSIIKEGAKNFRDNVYNVLSSLTRLPDAITSESHDKAMGINMYYYDKQYELQIEYFIQPDGSPFNPNMFIIRNNDITDNITENFTGDVSKAFNDIDMRNAEHFTAEQIESDIQSFLTDKLLSSHFNDIPEI